MRLHGYKFRQLHVLAHLEYIAKVFVPGLIRLPPPCCSARQKSKFCRLTHIHLLSDHCWIGGKQWSTSQNVKFRYFRGIVWYENLATGIFAVIICPPPSRHAATYPSPAGAARDRIPTLEISDGWQCVVWYVQHRYCTLSPPSSIGKGG